MLVRLISGCASNVFLSLLAGVYSGIDKANEDPLLALGVLERGGGSVPENGKFHLRWCI